MHIIIVLPQDVHATVSAHFKDIPRVNGKEAIHVSCPYHVTMLPHHVTMLPSLIGLLY